MNQPTVPRTQAVPAATPSRKRYGDRPVGSSTGGGRPSGSRRRSLTENLVVAGLMAIGVAVVYLLFVRTTRGQRLDELTFSGATGHGLLQNPARQVLDVVSITTVVLAVIAVVVIAGVRRRPGLALAGVVMIGGANLTTEVLKHLVLTRPVLPGGGGRPAFVDGSVTVLTNTLPSGHTTFAGSVAVAFLLVAPRRLRGVVAALGAVYTAATGIATMAAAWHRLSDVVAGVLVVGAWVGIVGALAAIVSRHQPAKTRMSFAVPALAVVGTLAAIASAIGMLAVHYGAPADVAPSRLAAVSGGGLVIACSLLVFAAAAALWRFNGSSGWRRH